MVECAETRAGYRELLRTSRHVVLAEGCPDPDYPEPVARTWDVLMRAAEAVCPATRSLMELLAFFAPEILPRGVLDADDKIYIRDLRCRLARNCAIRALVRFSLLRVGPAGLSVH